MLFYKISKALILSGMFVSIYGCGGSSEGSSGSSSGSVNEDSGNKNSITTEICQYNFNTKNGNQFGGNTCALTASECRQEARNFATRIDAEIDGEISITFFDDLFCEYER